MWKFRSNGRTSDVLAELAALDPETLPDALAQGIRLQMIALLRSMAPNAGVMVSVRSEPESGVTFSLERIKFGTYAD